MTPYIPSAYVDKMVYEPAWAMDSRSRTLIRRRLWFGRLGWFVATLLGVMLLWRATTQQREMSVLLQRLDAVEKVEQDVLVDSTYAAQRDTGRRQNVVMDTKDTGTSRKNAQDVPKGSMKDKDRDVDARNAPLLDRHTKLKRASWADIENLFVLSVEHRRSQTHLVLADFLQWGFIYGDWVDKRRVGSSRCQSS